MTRREDNSLLDMAEAHWKYMQDAASAFKIAGWCCAWAGLMLLALWMLHFA